MPQRLLRKAGTASHSGRIQRLQRMADDAIYRLAHRDAYNASFAARKTQKVKLTLAKISYDANRSAGLHNDCNSLARGSGRSANAMPGTGATAQRGHRGLERGDESTAITALRSIISCLLSRGGDT